MSKELIKMNDTLNASKQQLFYQVLHIILPILKGDVENVRDCYDVIYKFQKRSDINPIEYICMYDINRLIRDVEKGVDIFSDDYDELMVVDHIYFPSDFTVDTNLQQSLDTYVLDLKEFDKLEEEFAKTYRVDVKALCDDCDFDGAFELVKSYPISNSIFKFDMVRLINILKKEQEN